MLLVLGASVRGRKVWSVGGVRAWEAVVGMSQAAFEDDLPPFLSTRHEEDPQWPDEVSILSCHGCGHCQWMIST